MFNGISLQLIPDRWRVAGWADPGWYFSCVGDPKHPAGYLDEEPAESMMADIAKVIGHRETNLHGFTLFYHEGQGWQMSVRRKDEQGWDVKIIDGVQAQAVLSMLEASGHPDGPITVRHVSGPQENHQRALRASTAAFNRLTAALLAKVVEL